MRMATQEMQHRLNYASKQSRMCILKDYCSVLSMTPSVALRSTTVQCGNIWDSLYVKHQLRESNITLDRVSGMRMLAEFLIELHKSMHDGTRHERCQDVT